MIKKLSYNVMSFIANGCLSLSVGCLVGLAVRSNWGVELLNFFSWYREILINRLSYFLISPVYELILGITLGVDFLKSIPRFNDVAISLGLIHILVVSGYNINLVINLILKILPTKYNFAGFIAALIVAIFYALTVGLSAPVVRAAVMSIVFLGSSVLGRYRSPLYVLGLSLLFVLGYDHKLVNTISLQLSFLASFGLILIYNTSEKLLSKHMSFIPELFRFDLAATISAQLFTAPLILYYFNRVSIVSVLSNMLLLSLIPILTVLGFLLILFMFISVNVSNFIANVLSSISLLFFINSEIMSNSLLKGF